MADAGAFCSSYQNMAFPMIEVARILPKPRRHNMLLMSEVGIHRIAGYRAMVS